LPSLKTLKWVRASRKSSSSTMSRGSRFRRSLNLPPAVSTRRRFLPVQVRAMRILFDQGVPRGLAASLRGHEVTEAREPKWERISNGELLRLAEGAGSDLLLTTDKNVR